MKKVLIANRGEIAVRIARACKDYGVQSVAVYADSDADALHVRIADQAYALQGDTPANSYLSVEKLLAIAKQSGADAIHPGYGFLSESAAFAQAVLDAGLVWIGPSPQAIARLGDKVQARQLAQQVGAPLVAGTDGVVQNAQEVLQFAEQYGLPIAIKAAFGGGGRGMKVAWRMDEVVDLYASAVREATTAFGRGECFVEQFLDKPRHIEAQVMADSHGHVVVLGTRDCSLQRRNQKLVEEAPAPFLTDEQRTRIHQAAQAICAAAGYVGAGTVEFLLSRSGVISFLEVNTRLQVEHPVTEEVFGVDLVIEQLRVAEGLPLSFTQAPASRGHSMEFRLNAEDAGRGFLPTPGTITTWQQPSGSGVRVDSGVVQGSCVAGQFDSMMGKLIVTGANRAQVLQRAKRALAEMRIEGVASVLPFHQAVVQHADFASDTALAVHTQWIENEFAEPLQTALRAVPQANSTMLRTQVELDGRMVTLGLPASLLGLFQTDSAMGLAAATPAETANDGGVKAPLSGILKTWQVAEGANVQEGDVVAIMEAMKMEVQVQAPCAGQITQLVARGQPYDAGNVLAQINPAKIGQAI